MKKAVITILGIQGGYVEVNKYGKKEAVVNNINHQPRYKFSNKEKDYFNTLPILIEEYGNEYEIVPLYTEDAKIFNKKILQELYSLDNIKFDDSRCLIKDENKFDKIFSLYHKVIEDYDEVIIDVTHGFRHLPLLMLIDLIIINFRNIDKIKKIIFAKEIKKHTSKDKGEYEIIDLKEYLDLANITFALSSFNKNYTIPNNIKTTNIKYNEFLDELSNFSKHILANSLDELLITTKRKYSISDKIIYKIDKIIEDDSHLLENFTPFLLKIKNHIADIKKLNKKTDYEKMYYFAINMKDKGYLLNTITLLNEAIGLYAKELFKKISPDIKEFIESFENKVKQQKNNTNNKKYQLYSLSDQSKNLYKLGSGFNGDYLYIKKANQNERLHNEKAKDVTIKIKNYLIELKKSDRFYKNRVELIDTISRLRNNLAHGNSSQRLKNVEQDILNALSEFKKLFLNKE